MCPHTRFATWGGGSGLDQWQMGHCVTEVQCSPCKDAAGYWTEGFLTHQCMSDFYERKAAPKPCGPKQKFAPFTPASILGENRG